MVQSMPDYTPPERDPNARYLFRGTRDAVAWALAGFCMALGLWAVAIGLWLWLT